MYYGFIGCVITVVVGYVISLMTKFNEEDLYDEKLIHPFARKVASYFPGEKRRYADKTQTSFNNSTNSYLATSTTSVEPQKRTLKCYSQDVPLEDTETYNTKL